MKKTFVIGVLFVLPLVVYMFFASGVTNFGKLPVLSGPLPEISEFRGGERLQGKITILGFLGTEIGDKKGNAFNINQKIYKRFYEFDEFQVLMVVPEGKAEQVAALMDELSGFTDTRNWRFIYGSPSQIRSFFGELKTDLQLDENLATPYVFIIDKDRNLRGRDDDEDEGTKFGFDATSVAELNNKMEDDVKIILAEYRRALKKNNKPETAQ